MNTTTIRTIGRVLRDIIDERIVGCHTVFVMDGLRLLRLETMLPSDAAAAHNSTQEGRVQIDGSVRLLWIRKHVRTL